MPPVWRWTSRQTLAEERIWRATTPKYSGWAEIRSEKPAEVRPERLAGLYRQLRKAQEDAKNEPGAADFYYGEMEMRRHARTTPAAERGIIWLYWLISGYGLRALRSLGALIIVSIVATVALVGWGLAAVLALGLEALQQLDLLVVHAYFDLPRQVSSSLRPRKSRELIAVAVVLSLPAMAVTRSLSK